MTQENHALLLYQVKFQQRPLYPGTKGTKWASLPTIFSNFDCKLIGQGFGLEDDVLI